MFNKKKTKDLHITFTVPKKIVERIQTTYGREVCITHDMIADVLMARISAEIISFFGIDPEVIKETHT